MKRQLDILDLFTPEQVAASLGVSSRTVRNWINIGRLPATRPGGSRYLISRSDLEVLLRSSLVQSPPAPDLPLHVLPPLENVTEQQDVAGSAPAVSPLTNHKKNGRKS